MNTNIVGDRFDTKAAAVIQPFIRGLPEHDVANLQDAVAKALRDEQWPDEMTEEMLAPWKGDGGKIVAEGTGIPELVKAIYRSIRHRHGVN